ncbi:MAG: TetR/AcrR family transcriptional regulator C-terminal domain-containing protein [Lachnospiraceae bacterium]|nr:TetR/AcrR family transcriptional regulator C-terminal domain-containing protein [Lachnospiraceae bacterium]
MQQKREVKVLLSESFKELVLEKPVEKITIKQITDRAGVIRVTFYNHFQDKYELLEWICREEVVNPSRILLQNNMQREAVTFIFTALLKNKGFYSHVAHTSGQNSFESIMRDLISETITEYFLSNDTRKSGKYNWISTKWIADYYSQGFTFVLMSWIDKDMSVPPEDMVSVYEFISMHSVLDLPKEF